DNQQCPCPPARSSGLTRSCLRSVRAAWVRFIAPGTRVWTAPLRSKFSPNISQANRSYVSVSSRRREPSRRSVMRIFARSTMWPSRRHRIPGHEYLDGETLVSRLKKGPLPLDQVLRHACGITDALDTAHKPGPPVMGKAREA